jgi:hypothetical protein
VKFEDERTYNVDADLLRISRSDGYDGNVSLALVRATIDCQFPPDDIHARQLAQYPYRQVGQDVHKFKYFHVEIIAFLL